MSKKELKMQLLAYQFCLQELNLYLDSHPDDRVALAQFAECKEKFNALREQYVREAGPLTVNDATGKEHWDWIKGPWPWEYKEDDK